MEVGIIGLPFAGKTTLFQALTGLVEGTSGRGASLGVVKVPDPRVDHLAEVFDRKKRVLAEITLEDVQSGHRSGKGFDAQTVSAMKEMDALVILVDAPEGPSDEARDEAARKALDDVVTEMTLSDLVIVEKRAERIKKEKTPDADRHAVEKALDALSSEKPLRNVAFDQNELRALSGYQLLTRKPALVVVNVREGDQGKRWPRLEAAAEALGMPVISLCAALEREISALAPEERGEFLREMGIGEAARDRLVRAVYGLLDLISFLTVGDEEVRAWTCERGSPAPRAGGKVHTDIERGFIRAEVVAYDDFVAAGSSMAEARKAGKLKLEGKDYIIQDGDIVKFRFNV
jgi:GTP-binding protein YchF